MLEVTQCVSSQARTGLMCCISKPKISPLILNTTNPRQKESGLARDEHTDFCSNVSFLQLVHKTEDKSIKVGNDFAL